MKPILLFLLYGSFSISAIAQLEPFIVYPGDANNDSIVTVRDLLPVGIAFFQETLPRSGASPDWTPQFSEGFDFATLPVTNINLAHIDTNGDGFIDSLDTELIALNYDSVVTGSLPPLYQPTVPAVASYCPVIRIAFDRDTAQVGDTVLLEAFMEGFPDAGVPEEEGVLGTAFSIKYDPLNVKDSITRAFPDTTTGDLMFVHATAQRAGTSRSTLPPGRIDLAAAGYGVNAIQQNRLLARFSIIVEDMIFRSPDTTTAQLIAEVIPESILILNKAEQVFLPNCPATLKDTLLLFDSTSSIGQTAPKQQVWSLAPNPNHGHFTLTGNWPAGQVSIYNSLGQVLYQSPVARAEIVCPGLPEGLYYLVITSSTGQYTRVFQCLK
jgi:hypothetical protein